MAYRYTRRFGRPTVEIAMPRAHTELQDLGVRVSAQAKGDHSVGRALPRIADHQNRLSGAAGSVCDDVAEGGMYCSGNMACVINAVGADIHDVVGRFVSHHSRSRYDPVGKNVGKVKIVLNQMASQGHEAGSGRRCRVLEHAERVL